MINSKVSFIESLRTTFKVDKVHYEPHCESTWYLNYENKLSFNVAEIFNTEESDEQLEGKEIEAMIYINGAEILPTINQTKSMSNQGSFITATGIYEDDFSYNDSDDKYYIIDFLFKIRVSFLSRKTIIPVEKGKLLTIAGEARIELPRGSNIYTREELIAQKYGGYASDYIIRWSDSYDEKNQRTTITQWLENINTGRQYDLGTYSVAGKKNNYKINSSGEAY